MKGKALRPEHIQNLKVKQWFSDPLIPLSGPYKYGLLVT